MNESEVRYGFQHEMIGLFRLLKNSIHKTIEKHKEDYNNNNYNYN